MSIVRKMHVKSCGSTQMQFSTDLVHLSESNLSDTTELYQVVCWGVSSLYQELQSRDGVNKSPRRKWM